MLIDELSKTMKSGKQTDLILSDFCKAFDEVTHKPFLKFHHYGINGATLKWIKDLIFRQWETNSCNNRGKPWKHPSLLWHPARLSFRTHSLSGIHQWPAWAVKSRGRLFAADSAMYLAIISQSESVMLQQDLFNLENGKRCCTWPSIPPNARSSILSAAPHPQPNSNYIPLA